MPAFTSISNRALGALLILIAGALSSAALTPATAIADEPKRDRSAPPDSDDFQSTPFTEYGSFNEDADEDAETRFMQYGRLFGVSLGVGSEGATGNRGQMWQGGFPLLELKMHYWFDFQLAIDLVYATASHTYDATLVGSTGTFNVTSNRIGVDLKYYFDVKNLSAPISFCNPYILAGGGSFSKTQTNEQDPNSNDSDSALFLNAGVGLEFAVKPRKTYFELEGKVITATFQDTNQPVGSGNVIGDHSGMFYTISGSFLFTW